MKKAVVLLVVLGASVAFASSLGIPWFVDTAPAGAGFPPTSGQTCLIYLKNNTADVLECEIEYFNAAGTSLGPAAPANTFVIQPFASIAFRPVVADSSANPGGQENPAAGFLVPDRPVDVDTKPNGSAVIRWQGAPTDVQGMLAQVGARTDLRGQISYAHLLPPGS